MNFRLLYCLLGLTGWNYQLVTAVGSRHEFDGLDIEIVSPTFSGSGALSSLNYMIPAFTTGMESLRASLPQIRLTNQFLTHPNASDCLSHAATITDVVARWYYRERRNTSIPVMMATGQYIACPHVRHNVTNKFFKTFSHSFPPAVQF
ncbi:hypothetical protein BV898_02652 [Hypsibius exemplaris]|uniref:Uncharacterized protein n=1 Tax=Hypsibius exemplaris TaxID=2072580 RepID=A0A1W0X7N4_HYPEX|nr:hypothetical protein BV898_02652 [Hypsibius exemplaris]